MKVKVYVLIGGISGSNAEDYQVEVFLTPVEADLAEGYLRKEHGGSIYYHTQIAQRIVDVEEVEKFMDKVEDKNKEIEEKQAEKYKRLEEKEYHMRKLLKDLL